MIGPKAALLRRSGGRREVETRKSKRVPPGCTDHRRREAQTYQLFGARPAEVFWATETRPFQRKGEGEGIVRTQEMQKIPYVLTSQWEGARRGECVLGVHRASTFELVTNRDGAGVLALWLQETRECAWEPAYALWMGNKGSTREQERAKQGVTKSTS